MSDLHTATASPFVKALVAECVQFIKDFTPQDDGNPELTLYDLWTHMDDHLQVPLAVVVAEWLTALDDDAMVRAWAHGHPGGFIPALHNIVRVGIGFSPDDPDGRWIGDADA